jgi:DNA-binding NtrC family response regulator
MSRILVIDDEVAEFRPALEEALDEHELICVSNGEEGLAQAGADAGISAVLLDVRMPPRLGTDPDREGLAVLTALRQRDPDLPVIMLTVFSEVDLVVEACQAGAFHYLTKPPDLVKLRALVARAVEQRNILKNAGRGAEAVGGASVRALAGRLTAASLPTDAESPLIGASNAMRLVRERLAKVAPLNVAVLVLGESGTGKELAARELHRLSGRPGPFRAVNCAAIAGELLESNLFGHKKGAFTGAYEDRKGEFELAHGGTLLLDEIGDMELRLQAKLLRVLEDQRVTPLGASTAVQVDVRLVSSTNKDLSSLIAANAFREDLFFRLNVIPIRLPSLSERLDDLPLLVAHFVERFNQEFGLGVEGLSPTALARLEKHSWPGNVRELANEVRRAMVLAKGTLLTPECFSLAGVGAPSDAGNVDALWQRVLDGSEPMTSITAFRNRYGEGALREVMARAVIQEHDLRAAGKLLGCVGNVDEDKEYDNFRRWLKRLGLSKKTILQR